MKKNRKKLDTPKAFAAAATQAFEQAATEMEKLTDEELDELLEETQKVDNGLYIITTPKYEKEVREALQKCAKNSPTVPEK